MSLYAAVARRFCESSRHISRLYNIQPHQQRCVYKISRPKTSYYFQTYIRNAYSRNISHHFPYWRRYTFLSHLTTKSKISTSPAKKLFAAMGGVHASIHFYNLASASVARRFCESSRPFLCFFEYVLLPTTLITYNISPKPSPNIFLIGGETPFYAFGHEIEDFYLTRKKTGRRYGRRVCIYTIL